MNRTEIKFWSIFFLFNFILFLPKYILEIDTSAFFPFTELLKGKLHDIFPNFFSRLNYDIFRISVDLSLLTIIYYFFRKSMNSVIYSWVMGIYYFIILLFLVYYVSMDRIFNIEPILYNDLYLLRLGFYNSGGTFLKGIFFLIIAAAIIYFLIITFRNMLDLLLVVKFSIYSKIFLTLIGIAFIYNVIHSGTTFEPRHEFQETFALIIQNVGRSVDAYSIRSKIIKTDLYKTLNYNQYTWKNKPNIYIIFFESYGNILYTNPTLRKPYIRNLKACEDTLTSHGWNIASVLSTSPISGGGSWISYSSFMLGFNVKNQGTFLYLLSNPKITNYDQFFRLFRNKGYTNYRLNSVPDNGTSKIPWKNLTEFYCVDKWIMDKNFNYNGRRYGMGPSPPDQFALFYAGNYIQNVAKKPFTLFFINQNSHSPFFSPEEITENWLSLNDSSTKQRQKSIFFRRPRLEDYSRAISYDLNVFTSFIKHYGGNNDIFLIIGDHQPPFLTRKNDGFETPVHIISRDSAFVRGFHTYGFRSGLKVQSNSKPIKHEGLYSMFIREFLRQYGTDTSKLPVYKPNGFF